MKVEPTAEKRAVLTPSRNDLQATKDNPRHLWKFYGITRNTLTCLARREVWMSHIDDFNDPFDTMMWHTSRKHFEEFVASRIENGDHTRADLSEEEFRKAEMDRFVKADEAGQHVRQSGMFCVSGTPYENLLWSHYADNHRGFCIQYARTEMNDLGGALQVKYDDKQKHFMDIWSENQDINEAVDRVLEQKAECWDYEQEWRYVGFPSADPGKENRFYPLDAEIECVIFGCRTPHQDQLTIQRVLGLRDDQLFRMFQKPMTVDLYPFPINITLNDPVTGQEVDPLQRTAPKRTDRKLGA